MNLQFDNDGSDDGKMSEYSANNSQQFYQNLNDSNNDSNSNMVPTPSVSLNNNNNNNNNNGHTVDDILEEEEEEEDDDDHSRKYSRFPPKILTQNKNFED